MSVLTVWAQGVCWAMGDPGGRIGRQLRISERPYEHRLLDRIRRRGLSGSALDVGAHVGNHSLYMAQVCGLAVHAFEADPDHVATLRENVALNGADVTVHPYAAGRDPGWASFSEGQTLTVDGAGPVPVLRVDDEVWLDDLAVVKVDVEGMEAAALFGMVGHLERCLPVVYVESHTEADHRAHAGVLEPLGYRPGAPVHMGSRMDCWEPPE